jgi:uncharacterized protein (TIGR03546 family)
VFILKFISRIIKVLRAGPSPAQIGGGFALGMFLGLMPGFNFYWLLVCILIILVDVNISAAILGWMFFALVAFLLDPVFHALGYVLLANIEWLRDFWTSLYNLPVFPISRYNNTVVLGSLIISIILAVPVYYLVKYGIVKYREKLDPKIQKLKLVRVVKGSSVYNIYSRVRNLGD